VAPHGGWRQVGDLIPIQLESLELVQCAFHPLPVSMRRAPADPAPALNQKLLPLPIGLEVQAGNDPMPDQHRAHEMAEMRRTRASTRRRIAGLRGASRAGAEWLGSVEALGVQPDAARLGR
jgi:hypothetical protein